MVANVCVAICTSESAIMSKKATKVPVMKKGQPYVDWKKELKIWRMTNTKLGVEKEVVAGILFESLEVTPRDTVLSELDVEQISHVDGVDNIIKALDAFLLGNETQNAFTAHDDLMSFRRKHETNMEQFLIDFQLKVNKVKAAGTVLPEGVLGYTLLICANLPKEQMELCKATCDTLTFKNVKAQLLKIGLGKPTSSNKYSVGTSSSEANLSKVKIEDCFYGGASGSRQKYDSSSESSSADDDLNGGSRIYYSNKMQSNKFHKDRRLNQHPYKREKSYYNYDSKYKLNPTDKFGHVTECSYCKCVYHWLVDCPFAPAEVKNDILSKNKRNNRYQKPL